MLSSNFEASCISLLYEGDRIIEDIERYERIMVARDYQIQNTALEAFYLTCLDPKHRVYTTNPYGVTSDGVTWLMGLEASGKEKNGIFKKFFGWIGKVFKSIGNLVSSKAVEKKVENSARSALQSAKNVNTLISKSRDKLKSDIVVDMSVSGKNVPNIKRITEMKDSKILDELVKARDDFPCLKIYTFLGDAQKAIHDFMNSEDPESTKYQPYKPEVYDSLVSDMKNAGGSGSLAKLTKICPAFVWMTVGETIGKFKWNTTNLGEWSESNSGAKVVVYQVSGDTQYTKVFENPDDYINVDACVNVVRSFTQDNKSIGKIVNVDLASDYNATDQTRIFINRSALQADIKKMVELGKVLISFYRTVMAMLNYYISLIKLMSKFMQRTISQAIKQGNDSDKLDVNGATASTIVPVAHMRSKRRI